MDHKTVCAKKAPIAVGPYSHGIACGGFLFSSGIIPMNPDTNKIVFGGIAEQTEQVFRNIISVLEAENLTIANIVKMTVYLTNMEDIDKVNAIYGAHFKENRPARTCIEVSALQKNAMIEIEFVAHY